MSSPLGRPNSMASGAFLARDKPLDDPFLMFVVREVLPERRVV